MLNNVFACVYLYVDAPLTFKPSACADVHVEWEG